ncbi:MarR family transcriptional regulator [Cutibacterium equinum]|uniref:MarR family transcriptional regulator n=1 Tax=Cutibacterium equinum TaxID=3016342 RepID=A0ABY7R0W2_9ACTN|nr:MarR family transcriptional regulator [Cutibacterium equinum]WCC80917.1 MarR family transcriptional regulator [Cutibacterium equinum]
MDRGHFFSVDQAAELAMVCGRVQRHAKRMAGVPGASVTWRVLHTIETEGPLPMGVLTRIEGTKPATTTDLINRLVDKGYVTRTPKPGDARTKLIAITDEGRRYCRESERKVGEGLADTLNEMSIEERRILLAALPTLSHLVTVLRYTPINAEAASVDGQTSTCVDNFVKALANEAQGDP